MICTPTSGVATPPVNPTNGQLSQAAKDKASLASTVGDLESQVSSAQNRLQLLSANAELAEQKAAYAQSQWQQATQQAAAAQASVQRTQQAVATARTALAAFVSDSYIQPTVTSGVGNVLTATDPNALLQRGDYLRYVGDRHVDAVAALDRAIVAQSNAVAKARGLVQVEQVLAANANATQAAALQAMQAQREQTAVLTASLSDNQAKLAAAQQQLATLNGQRAVYTAYVQEQAKIAAAKAKAEAEARARALAAQRALAAANLARQQAAERLAAQQAAEQVAAQQAAAAAAAQQSSSGGSATTIPAPVAPTPSVPLPTSGSVGGWTPSAGQAAATRALCQVGVQYAWDGGNYNGPTFGVNYPGTAGWNDSTHYGFDCSGLMMYAWAPQGLYLAHYAATQFTQAGSLHPVPGTFQPGDLLFWSSDGTVSGIHHVAMYIGNGNVVQAPNSNDVVKITPWDQVDWGYFGATRPLT